jgi:hypothetical protein
MLDIETDLLKEDPEVLAIIREMLRLGINDLAFTYNSYVEDGFSTTCTPFHSQDTIAVFKETIEHLIEKYQSDTTLSGSGDIQIILDNESVKLRWTHSSDYGELSLIEEEGDYLTVNPKSEDDPEIVGSTELACNERLELVAILLAVAIIDDVDSPLKLAATYRGSGDNWDGLDIESTPDISGLKATYTAMQDLETFLNRLVADHFVDFENNAGGSGTIVITSDKGTVSYEWDHTQLIPAQDENEQTYAGFATLDELGLNLDTKKAKIKP